MNLKQQIDADLKTAMLAGDKVLVTTLRGLKSAVLNMEIAKGARETGLPETEVIDILAKESKKRQESADMYTQGNSPERAAAELEEKSVIEKYLPKQMDESEISTVIDEIMKSMPEAGQGQMGQIIGAVKARTAGSADGGVIARLIKEKLA
jgi:uncharacterized protein YqeY